MGDGTPENINVRFWSDLRDLRERMQRDPRLFERFGQDPAQVLRESGLDIEVPTGPGDASRRPLSSLLEQMTPDERRITLQAMVEVSGITNIERVAAVTPVANANAGANANAIANANAGANANAAANANTNTNTNGFSARDLIESNIAQVVLPADFAASTFASRFAEMQLNPERQAALLRRVLTDSDSIVESRGLGDAQFRVSRYTFRGVQIEVEGLIRANRIEVTRARVI